MEIRCDNCGHVGPASEVRPTAEAVGLVCENCGHENVLSTGGSGADGSTVVAESAPAGSREDGDEKASQDAAELVARLEAEASDGARASFGDGADAKRWLQEDALEALVPEPGDGPRCRKCAQLVPPEADNCPRCGLDRHEAARFPPGEAPWEKPPEGKQAEQEQATLLWQTFQEEPSDDNLQKFVDVARREELLDFAIRKLRFYLVDHPDDEMALEHLHELAESLQSKLIVAQARAQASADEFQQDVGRFKRRLIVVTLVFWGGVFLFFLVMFWDSCSGVSQL